MKTTKTGDTSILVNPETVPICSHSDVSYIEHFRDEDGTSSKSARSMAEQTDRQGAQGDKGDPEYATTAADGSRIGMGPPPTGPTDNLPWVEKYRPSSLQELVCHREIMGTRKQTHTHAYAHAHTHTHTYTHARAHI